MLQNLNAKKVEVYDDVKGEPDVNMATKCSEFARKVDPELIVALGGGSVIDLAKFARVAMEVNIDPREVKAKLNLRTLGFRKRAKLVAVPTTSGSGADATLAVMLKHGNSKISAINPEFIPLFEISVGDEKGLRAFLGLQSFKSLVTVLNSRCRKHEFS